MMRRGLILASLSILLAAAAEAGKPLGAAAPAEVGHSRPLTLVPDLTTAQPEASGRLLWREIVQRKDASFLKPHFVDVNLRAGDVLVVRSATGKVVEEIRTRGPKSLGSFWGLSAFGDTLQLELAFDHAYGAPPFRIDQLIEGFADLFEPPLPGEEPESICAPEDFDDVICFDDDPGKWANVLGSVGVMSVGGSPASGLWCSGSNVSPQNYLMTNYHCIGSQGGCDGAEFVFKYYRTDCNTGAPPTADWQSFRCDQMVAGSPDGPCDPTPTQLDFSLHSVIGDPAATFGYAVPDPTPLASGEEVYIIQHPDGRPHEITHGGGPAFVVDGITLRYYDTLDTEPGSSGSPIYRELDDKLVGLHHCGGCETPGTGNRGMRMTDIVPLIQSFLCTQGAIELRAATPGGLAEVFGNGDAVVDPAEIWSFLPAAANTSCDLPAPGVTAQIQLGAASATPVTVLDPSVAFGTIGAGTTQSATAAVELQVGGSAPCGGTVILDLVDLDTNPPSGPFADTPGYLSVPIGEEVLTTLFLEDWSGGLGSWTVVDRGTGSGAAATWTLDNPGGRSLPLTPPFAIADSDQLGSGFLMDEQLISPPIDVTGFATVTLQFAHDFHWYSSGGNEQADVAVCSAATGGDCGVDGLGWVTVANFSGGDTSGTVSLDVTPYAAVDLRILFHYFDAEYDWWWAVDDVYLLGSNGYQCSSAVEIFADGFDSGDCSGWSTAEP